MQACRLDRQVFVVLLKAATRRQHHRRKGETMAKYIFAYHGGGMAETEAEQAKIMEAWGAWMGSLGAALVDGGARTASSTTVTTTGVTDDGGANPISGYSLYEADDVEAAIKAAQGCPILDAGGSVEVAALMEM